MQPEVIILNKEKECIFYICSRWESGVKL